MLKNTELKKWIPIKAAIEEYNQALIEVKEGFDLLASARSRMKIFGNYRDKLWEGNLHGYKLNDRLIDECHQMMKKQAWEGIIEKAQVRELLSSKKTAELDRQLEDVKNLPELSLENIQGMIGELQRNINGLLMETIQETFEWLRPHRSRHKTNTEYEVGEKVIKEWMFDTSYGMCFLYSGGERGIQSLDNVFHLLDGKGPARYPGNAVTAIREAIRDKKWETETAYFRFKWFKNGNLHIKFKQTDLVAELNRRAGGNRIKS